MSESLDAELAGAFNRLGFSKVRWPLPAHTVHYCIAITTPRASPRCTTDLPRTQCAPCVAQVVSAVVKAREGTSRPPGYSEDDEKKLLAADRFAQGVLRHLKQTANANATTKATIANERPGSASSTGGGVDAGAGVGLGGGARNDPSNDPAAIDYGASEMILGCARHIRGIGAL